MTMELLGWLVGAGRYGKRGWLASCLTSSTSPPTAATALLAGNKTRSACVF